MDATAWQEELESMLQDDQQDIAAVRSNAISGETWLDRVRERSSVVESLLDTHGMASVRSDRSGAYKAMLVLILHSGDTRLMKKYLKQHQSTDASNVLMQDRAFIEDKIMLEEMGVQLYGTQFKLVDGAVTLLPIFDEKNVDKRRLKIGLSFLEQYVSSVARGSDVH